MNSPDTHQHVVTSLALWSKGTHADAARYGVRQKTEGVRIVSVAEIQSLNGGCIEEA